MHARRSRTALLIAVLGLAAAGCGSGSKPAASTTASSAKTVWLCRPGAAGDPCARSLATTIVAGDGSRRVRAVRPAADSRFDCFYVYPTVSTQKTTNANLKVEPSEVGTAVEQASQFSQVCRVWAPMYRQQTVAGLLDVGSYSHAINVAFESLLAGWRDYLSHSNGRPFVLIGHSQGAAMLIKLIRSQIDPSPQLRKRLVSAIVLGGNVQVPTGKAVGGSFEHVPACRAAGETGCVIAYSSFPGPPPSVTFFGRPGTGVSVLSGQTATTGQQVLCVNPAALAGGTGALEPAFTASVLPPPGKPVSTPWVTYPGLYTAACRSAGGDTWLQVNNVGSAADKRPRLTEQDGPSWGFHVADVNLALGNLVEDVRRQEANY